MAKNWLQRCYLLLDWSFSRASCKGESTNGSANSIFMRTQCVVGGRGDLQLWGGWGVEVAGENAAGIGRRRGSGGGHRRAPSSASPPPLSLRCGVARKTTIGGCSSGLRSSTSEEPGRIGLWTPALSALSPWGSLPPEPEGRWTGIWQRPWISGLCRFSLCEGKRHLR